jgi:L-aspartate oxidase
VRPILSQGLGVLREQHGMERAIRGLYPLASGHSAAADPALVGLMIAVAAWPRQESRGGHFRNDFPDALPAAEPSFISLADALDTARNVVETKSLSVGSAQP